MLRNDHSDYILIEILFFSPQRRTEEYFKSVNTHVLTLPCIENPETNAVQIPHWCE